jgi:malate dehydrogenase (oxaloacetate-decarboxylating)
MDIYEKSLELHKKMRGKLSIISKMGIKTREDLSLLYTPGVAEASRRICANELLADELTLRSNLVAVISDGSAVLGLGNIGPKGAMPVMEGKAVLFKEFGGVDAMPLCIDTQNVDEIVRFTKLVSPTFGGINFEDISAPRCFEIEEKLRGNIDIPIFHDDQHGTSIVVGAGLMNALKVVGKSIKEVRIVINGVGSAGYSIARFLLNYGAKNLLLCDIGGVLNPDNPETMLHRYHRQLAEKTNRDKFTGRLNDALKGADVFIGVSSGNILTEKDIQNMNKDAIVFAMANPTPEIHPNLAKKGGAKVVATGRSDFPNQVNNVLAFPGVFRGALDVSATEINEHMKISASKSLADYIVEPKADYIIPDALDKKAVVEVALATGLSAIDSGVAVKPLEETMLRDKIEKIILGNV